MTFTTLPDLLRWRAVNQPAQRAFTFLVDGDLEKPVHLTYAELDRRACETAARLAASIERPSTPVLLLFPPGLDVLSALFGAFYAGAIAIIADHPRRRSSLSPIESIVNDAEVTVGVTSCMADIEVYLARSEALRRLRWVTIEDTGRSSSSHVPDTRAIRPDALAVLQYTSGSTGTPKGVMVSHANLVHNSGILQRRFRQDESSRTVFWLPLSHDMGLVGGVLQPLYTGYPGTLMPPLSFLQRPTRWLQAISALRGTTSAAPNFAYELCVRKTSPEQRDDLDLSAWDVAINGAEPVQAQTLERFSEFFAPCGFRREAFCPSYGLAEATLMVSGEKRDRPPAIVSASTGAPGQVTRQTSRLVGCGRADDEQRVVIVDPALALPCEPATAGEIWVAGASVARGYWNRSDETQTTFGAYLADSGDGPFLRTGDLGYVSDDELFITGRLKEIVIVRGVNYSPSAIEETVERSHPSLRRSCGATFVTEADGDEHLVVVQELERSFLRTLPEEEVFTAIRHAVAEEHGLEVHAIVLLRTTSLPKTVTNKTRRRAVREAYLAGALDHVAVWSAPSAGRLHAEMSPVEAAPPVDTGREDAIRAWLVEKLSRQLNVPATDMDVRRPFAEYGFDSAAVVGLAGDLEDYFGCELSPTLAYDYPTIEALSGYLAATASASDARASGVV
jgi:acyl-CoA synthetase (AMP-forming)/AMP-acid ligase II/acyl carrier protein